MVEADLLDGMVMLRFFAIFPFGVLAARWSKMPARTALVGRAMKTWTIMTAFSSTRTSHGGKSAIGGKTRRNQELESNE